MKAISTDGEKPDWLKKARVVDLGSCVLQVKGRKGYESFFQGHVQQSDVSKTVPCDAAFLVAIIDDLDSLAFAWLDCMTEEGQDVWQSALDLVTPHIDKLSETPELISDKDAHHKFFAYLSEFCAIIEYRPPELSDKDMVQMADAMDKAKYRKPYVPIRLPWHQFLHDRAPGSGTKINDYRPSHGTGTRQIIPHGGLRLLREWEIDFENYESEIYPQLDALSDSMIEQKIKWKERALGGKTRY